jgi:hypothetical protein
MTIDYLAMMGKNSSYLLKVAVTVLLPSSSRFQCHRR